MHRYIQVATTVGTKADAENIARILVSKRLAACVQILGPITSVYKWKGKIERTKEWVCVAKTKASLFRSVEKAILAMHPYDVPEILATTIINGNAAYMRWLDGELRKD